MLAHWFAYPIDIVSIRMWARLHIVFSEFSDDSMFSKFVNHNFFKEWNDGTIFQLNFILLYSFIVT